VIHSDDLPTNATLILHVSFVGKPHMKTIQNRVESVLRKYGMNGLLKTEMGSSHIISCLLNGNEFPNQGSIAFGYTLTPENGSEKAARTHLKRMINALLRVREMKCVEKLYIYHRDYVGVA